MSPQKLH